MAMTAMLEHMCRNWGWMALRGVVAVLFGVFAVLWPGKTLAALVIVFGAYALADGILALIEAFKVRDQGRPVWSLLLVGLAGIAAGVFAFLWPGMTAFVLLICIAAWAIVMGVFQIVAAIRLRKEISNEWLLGLSGALSVIFGALLFLRPGQGALALILVIGAYSIVFGIMLIILGFQLRSRAQGTPAAA